MKHKILTGKNGIVYKYLVTTRKSKMIVSSNCKTIDIIHKFFGINVVPYEGNNLDVSKFYVKDTGIIYVEKMDTI